MESRPDLVDGVWYDADRAFAQDILEGTTKSQHLMDGNVKYSLLRTTSALTSRLYHRNVRLCCALPSRNLGPLALSELSKTSGDPTSRP